MVASSNVLDRCLGRFAGTLRAGAYHGPAGLPAGMAGAYDPGVLVLFVASETPGALAPQRAVRGARGRGWFGGAFVPTTLQYGPTPREGDDPLSTPRVERIPQNAPYDGRDLPAAQAQCVQVVLDAAEKFGRSVRIVDVSDPAQLRSASKDPPSDLETLPVLVRSDGRRLYGEENFRPSVVWRFLSVGVVP